jgi:hypothetical protein
VNGDLPFFLSSQQRKQGSVDVEIIPTNLLFGKDSRSNELFKVTNGRVSADAQILLYKFNFGVGMFE